MKTLEIEIGKHKAVTAFKKIPSKKYESIKWKIINQNLDEITMDFYSTLNKNKGEN